MWDLKITLFPDGTAYYTSNPESGNYDLLQIALKERHRILYKPQYFKGNTSMKELAELSRFFIVRLS